MIHKTASKMKNESAVLLICLFVSCCSAFKFSYPLHASCKVDWTFSAGCDEFQHKIVQTIEKLTGPAGCDNGGEKCLYSLRSSTSEEIQAVHQTPVKGYKDDLTFTMTTQQSGCAVHGFSTSETWYALLDKGTNYCNLRNLIDESGLSKDPAFTEKTSDSECTEYSSHDCDKY